MPTAVLAAMDAAPPGVTVELIPVSLRRPVAPGSLIHGSAVVAVGLFGVAEPCRYCGSDDPCECQGR